MKIVMPVYEDVDMLDVCGPYEMFRWAGFDVQLVAEVPGAVRFNRGFTFDVGRGARRRHRLRRALGARRQSRQPVADHPR